MGFLSLQTALSGIRASQIGMDTASHNIANAGTLGYTRQRVELAQRIPFNAVVGQIGTGVDVTGIHRTRDAFLDDRARASAAELGRAGTRAELLTRTEAVMGEPDLGLSAALSAVWDAFDDLAADPSGAPARQQVLSALNSLASRARSVSGGWNSLARDAAMELESTVAEVGSNLERLAELNRLIPSVAGRAEPNQLLDERDRLLDELAAAIGASATLQDDGTVTVTLAGAPVPLLEGQTVTPVTVDADHAVRVQGQEVTAGGRVGGLHDFLVSDLPAQRAHLDDFLDALVTTLNAQHAAGLAPNGAPGGPLLSFTPGLAVTDLAVAITDPAQLAAADIAGGVQNGRNAQALADLRIGGPAGGSLNEQLVQLVVGLAGEVRTAAAQAEAQQLLNVSATAARQSAHGVSLDEEMVALVQWQRSLEAAARVMTTVDEALDVLVNRTGIVGR